MIKSELDLKTKKLLAGAAIAVFIIFTAALTWLVGKPLVAFASEPDKFRAWIDASGLWGRVAFIGMTVVQIMVALIPGEPLEIGAGYAFGALEGTLLCELGIAIGTMLVYFFVKKFGVKALEVFFSIDKINSLRFLKDTKRLYLLTILLYFIPGTPKDLITYFIGLTRIKLLPLLLISTVARLPSVITSTLSGGALGDTNYKMAIAVFAATAIVSAVGILIYRLITKAKVEPKD